jgi:hypothetical protein
MSNCNDYWNPIPLIKIHRKAILDCYEDMLTSIYFSAVIHGGYITLIFDCKTHKYRIISNTYEIFKKRGGESIENYKNIKDHEVYASINITQEDSIFLEKTKAKNELECYKDKILSRLVDLIHEEILKKKADFVYDSYKCTKS